MSKRIDEYIEENPTSGAAAIGLNASGDTRRLSLGSAAKEDVQTSPTDTTADRLMKVGAFGLGLVEPPSESIDLDNIIHSGFWTAELASNSPGTGSFRGPLIHAGRIADRWIQIAGAATSAASNSLFFRERSGEGISPWNELYHSGNDPSDTAWTTTTSLSNGWTGTVWYIKRAGWVTVVIDLDGSTGHTSTIVLSLPSAYDPAGNMRAAVVGSAGTDEIARMDVLTSGAVAVSGDGDTNSQIRGSVTYPVI